MKAKEAKLEFDRANDLYRQKRYPEALQLLDQLDAQHPFTKNIMYPRALCLVALGRTDEALDVCDQLFSMFQDTRALELKSHIQTTVKANAAAASATKKTGSKASSRGGDSLFSLRNVVVVLVVVAAGAAGYFYFARGEAGAPSTQAEDTQEEKPAQTGAVAKAQEELDKQMRAHIENTGEPFTVLYDTGTPSKDAFTSAVVKARTGWTEVPEGKTDHAFQGDAVFMNNQVMLVLRKEGTGAELWGNTEGYQWPYANLVPRSPTATGQGIDAIAVTKCAPDEVVLEVTHRTGAEPLKVSYQLAMGQVFVKVLPVEKATRLRVEAPGRFAVLPDFFADDIVIDARDIPTDRADLPSENFLMQMLGSGEAIVMSVWENRNQDVEVVLAGQAMKREIKSSEIAFGQGGAVWVALLTDPGVWHTRDIRAEEKGVELPLNWKWPYPALWRVDWQHVDKLSSDKLTDSWEMLTQEPNGDFKKHGLFQESEDSWTAMDWWGSGQRTRIASGLGRFKYPCWVDSQGQGWLQPLTTAKWQGFEPMSDIPEFKGPAVIYPINRIGSTPLDKFTVVDVVRASLGVGPCQYILDVEGQSEEFKGLPTCAVRDVMNEIYEKGEQKQRAADVERLLNDVVTFIGLIRGRIDKYGEFSKEMQAFLQESTSKYPDQKVFIEKMQTLTAKIDSAIDQRLESIKSVEYAQELADDFRSEVAGNEGEDAVAKCKEFTEAWVEIGGNQDTLVAECRVAVKRLRQRAALGLTADPKRAELVEEIRARSEKILRAPVNYEAPRH